MFNANNVLFARISFISEALIHSDPDNLNDKSIRKEYTSSGVMSEQ